MSTLIAAGSSASGSKACLPLDCSQLDQVALHATAVIDNISDPVITQHTHTHTLTTVAYSSVHCISLRCEILKCVKS